MDSQQHNDTNENDKDELYFKIWEREHSDMQARWTITTFFMSVSFAILGFSLQAKPTSTSALIAQSIVALAVYWFAYLLNKRLYYYTTFLRTQLRIWNLKQLSSCKATPKRQRSSGACQTHQHSCSGSDWCILLAPFPSFGS